MRSTPLRTFGRWAGRAAVLLVLLGKLAACEQDSLSPVGGYCRSPRDCEPGLRCVSLQCREFPPSSGDAGADQGTDQGTTDLGTDQGADQGVDMGPPDTGIDLGPPDMGVDLGPLDMGADMGPPDMGAADMPASG